MKTKGLVFFSDWTAPVPLLAVALHSLEKFYKGDIHVFYGSHTPPFFIDILKSNKRISTQSFTPDYLKLVPWAGHSNVRRIWASKPIIHKQSPFDVSILYDCDHVFLKDFDMKGFDFVEKHGLVTFTHPSSRYGGRGMRKANGRAAAIRDVVKLSCPPDTLFPSNGGCVGSVKGTKLLDEWLVYLEKFSVCNDWRLNRLPDEFSLSYTLSVHNIPFEGDKWSYSPAKDLSDLHPLPDISAIHFCATSYRLGSHYRTAQEAALAADYMKLSSCWKQYFECNSYIEEARKGKVV